jgi:hypothetical protein
MVFPFLNGDSILHCHLQLPEVSDSRKKWKSETLSKEVVCMKIGAVNQRHSMAMAILSATHPLQH